MNKIRELMDKRAGLLDAAKAIFDAAEAEERSMTDAEQADFDGKMEEADKIQARIQAAEAVQARAGIQFSGQAPAVLRIPRGDSEVRAWAHWVKTGDDGGIRDLRVAGAEARASNDTTMNITTDADGGYAVPVGHYNEIISRRDESMLAIALGCRNIPGTGTTVNIPVDNEADGEFVATAESAEDDRDAPALGQVVSTLAKYTKRVDLTGELLEDEDSKLMQFLENFVGRGLAKTHNSLLLTEVAANGTNLQTFASATVIAVDELEPIVYNDDLEPYLDDDAGSVAWVMRRSVHGEIALLDDANTRRYANNQQGNEGRPDLLGFPVQYSYKAGATAASAVSAYFGNWFYVGWRQGAGISVLRDPYSRASYDEILLHYKVRIKYNVLIAEAIGYADHPSA